MFLINFFNYFFKKIFKNWTSEQHPAFSSKTSLFSDVFRPTTSKVFGRGEKIIWGPRFQLKLSFCRLAMANYSMIDSMSDSMPGSTSDSMSDVKKKIRYV